ncbi:MAG: outer membrane protein transport protein [Ignavibacteriae bacterium]|nr:outer membrane protein transport protein [Ignavibacteriota bacterium]
MMKKIFTTAINAAFLSVMLTLCSFAQFSEDALRLSFPGLGVGARSLGLGTAYTGVADDFTAAQWNPAGLAQMRMNEISLGFSHLSYGNTSTFFNASQSITNSSTSLNSLGLVYSVPTVRGSFVIGVGYGRQSDFTTGLSFRGFNPSSSIIQSWAPDGVTTDDPRGNLAYELYLANADSLSPMSYRWDSKIKNNVTQSGTVLEGGGLNHWSVSGAIEAARNFFIGATLNFISGSYAYSRQYYEDDLRNFYDSTSFPFDLKTFSLQENIESDLSGFTMKLGMLYRFERNSRLGIAVKTPSWVTVRETFSQSGMSEFDDGDHFEYTTFDRELNEYDVRTPFIFSAGLSYAIQDLMLSGDVEYADWTQMEFRNADTRLLSFNTLIKEIFQPTVNVRVGAEYGLHDAGVRLRGGFAYLPSPYEGDPSSFARKYITGGIGFIVENAIAVDAAYAHGFWDTFRVNYNETSKTNERVKTNNIIATVSYRF